MGNVWSICPPELDPCLYAPDPDRYTDLDEMGRQAPQPEKGSAVATDPDQNSVPAPPPPPPKVEAAHHTIDPPEGTWLTVHGSDNEPRTYVTRHGDCLDASTGAAKGYLNVDGENDPPLPPPPPPPPLLPPHLRLATKSEGTAGDSREEYLVSRER